MKPVSRIVVEKIVDSDRNGFQYYAFTVSRNGKKHLLAQSDRLEFVLECVTKEMNIWS